MAWRQHSRVWLDHASVTIISGPVMARPNPPGPSLSTHHGDLTNTQVKLPFRYFDPLFLASTQPNPYPRLLFNRV